MNCSICGLDYPVSTPFICPDCLKSNPPTNTWICLTCGLKTTDPNSQWLQSSEHLICANCYSWKTIQQIPKKTLDDHPSPSVA